MHTLEGDTPVIVEKSPPSIPEIHIPEEVQEDLRAGVLRVMENVRAFNPDHIVVLQRRGPIAFQAAQAYAETHDITLPPIIESPIRRATAARFMNEIIIKAESEGIDLFEKGFPSIADFPDEFKTWAREDRGTKDIIEALRRKLGDQTERVLVVDDSESEGLTRRIVAPALVEVATGDAVTVNSEILFRDGSWAEKIIASTFGKIPRDEEYYLTELMKGATVDLEGNLHPTNLQVLGDVTYEMTGRNPYQKLKERYGDEALTHLASKIRAAVRKVGEK